MSSRELRAMRRARPAGRARPPCSPDLHGCGPDRAELEDLQVLRHQQCGCTRCGSEVRPCDRQPRVRLARRRTSSSSGRTRATAAPASCCSLSAGALQSELRDRRRRRGLPRPCRWPGHLGIRSPAAPSSGPLGNGNSLALSLHLRRRPHRLPLASARRPDHAGSVGEVVDGVAAPDAHRAERRRTARRLGRRRSPPARTRRWRCPAQPAAGGHRGDLSDPVRRRLPVGRMRTGRYRRPDARRRRRRAPGSPRTSRRTAATPPRRPRSPPTTRRSPRPRARHLVRRRAAGDRHLQSGEAAQLAEVRPTPLAAVTVEDPGLGGNPVEMWSYPVIQDGHHLGRRRPQRPLRAAIPRSFRGRSDRTALRRGQLEPSLSGVKSDVIDGRESPTRARHVRCE